MEIERRIFRNTFVMTVGQGIVQLVNLCFVIYFARVFGAGTLGDYSFAMAIGALCSIFVSLGTHSLAIKSISQDIATEIKIIGSLIPFEIITGSIIFISVFVFLEFVPIGNRLYAMILLILAYNIIIKWTDLLCTRFQAREKMGYVAYADVIRQILRVTFGFLLIWQLNDPVAAIGVFPVCALFVLIWMMYATTKQYGAMPLSINLRAFKELVIKAWPYGSLILMGILYERLGIIFLTFMHSEVTVGYFTMAERLVVALGIIHAMFISSIFPAMTRLVAHEKKIMPVLAVRCLRLVLVFVLPAASLLFLLSDEVIAVLYGDEFDQSVIILQIVSWVLVFRGLNSYLSMLAIAEDNQSYLSKIKFSALLFFVVISVPLVYLESAEGLSYSILLSEIFLSALLLLLFRKASYFLGLIAIMWRTLLVCVVLIAVGMTFIEQPLFYRLVILSVTLVVAMISMGAIKYHDLRFLRDILFDSK